MRSATISVNDYYHRKQLALWNEVHVVDAIIEYCVILEKAKALEARMRYQIDKLVHWHQPNARISETEGRLCPSVPGMEKRQLIAVTRHV